MDYVPAHGDRGKLADRDNISGARVFDGEDQGKHFQPLLLKLEAFYLFAYVSLWPLFDCVFI